MCRRVAQMQRYECQGLALVLRGNGGRVVEGSAASGAELIISRVLGPPIILRLASSNMQAQSIHLTAYRLARRKVMRQCTHTASHVLTRWLSSHLMLEASIGCMDEMPKRSHFEISQIRHTTRDAEVFQLPQRGPIHNDPLACALRA